ncbi:heterokaryon incompatibility protein-domain-containing protein, partial [Halenospora varia]
MASFQYPKLDHHAPTVRLLTINHDNGRKISGKLYRVSLDKQPSFVAISYLWGNSTADTEITLNGKPFMVRNNVERLLHEMRDQPKLKWRFFWIDSICINQHNFDERNHQVKLMKQIYTKAAEVVIWLGPETAQTDVAMDWISRQDEEPQQVKVSDGFLGHRNQDASRCFWQDQEGKAILDFFQQKYWERVWVIQEIMNARNIRVFCGTKSFPWRNLENVLSHLIAIRMLSWFGRYRYALEVLHSRAAIIVEEKRRWELRTGLEKDGLPLSILIPRYSHLESTNRLDKVYGLLGISSDEILVDYHQSPRQVFCEVL